jgi:hypothetical protein
MDATTNQALTPAVTTGIMPSIVSVREGATVESHGGALCSLDHWIANNPALALALTVGAAMLLKSWRRGGGR